MTEFNKRERYLISRAFEHNMIKLHKSGDYPEQKRDEAILVKLIDWISEIKGNITSDEGVGE